MEGRISRESLVSSGEKETDFVNAPDVERSSSYTPRRSTRSGYGYGGHSNYSSYRRRTNSARSEVIPEGRDLFVVQVLVSGILLLFIMFVTIVESDGTAAVRDKLATAFEKNTSFSEVADDIRDIKAKIAGAEQPVKEIKAETFSEGDEAGADSEQILEAENVDDAVVDPDLLKQINAQQEEYSKN